MSGSVNASGTISNSGAYTSTYHIDTTPAAISLVNGGTVSFSSFSGMIIANSYNDGHVSLYLCGGGGVTAVANAAGSCGTISWSGSAYQFTNNSGSTQPFGFCIIRTRPSG